MKMNGIKMSDCKFYVDKEARTVVCVIPSIIAKDEEEETIIRHMLQDFVKSNFEWNDFDVYDGLRYGFYEKLELPSSFMGKAVCAQGDEWDEELGKMIAFSRAKHKCYNSFFKRANLLVQTLDRRLGDMITAFNDLGLKLTDRHDALQDKINEKMGKEKEGDT